MKLELLKIFGLMFVGGVATSYAEYHFKYSLFTTLAGLIAKIRGKKAVAAPSAPAAAEKK